MRARALLVVVGWTTACGADLPEREPVDTGTFGTTVVTLACKRVAYLEDLADGDGTVDVRGDDYRDVCRLGLAPPAGAPETLKALQAKRDQLIEAVDATFPEPFLPDVQTFLTSPEFLALYDSGEVIAAVDDLIELLRLAADDAALTAALERLSIRIGYVPGRERPGTLAAVAGYPELHAFLAAVMTPIAPGGDANDELDSLLAALAVTLRNAEPSTDPNDDDSTGRIALRLLLGENALLDGRDPLLLARRDHRGVVKVAVDAGGALPAPFADRDADGLADTDDLGRFVDDDGNPIDSPAPFEPTGGDPGTPIVYRDEAGRALDRRDGEPLYEYVDLDRTVLAALARDGVRLFDPSAGTALDLARGASALLSTRPRVPVTRRYPNGERLDYRGFDVAESPLLDMIYGYLSVLADPAADELLALTRILIVDHESETAHLVEAFLTARDLAATHDEAIMDPSAPFADDLVPLVRDILAVPGLAEDVMLALEDPALASLDLRLRDYAHYTDWFGFDADQNLVGTFSTPVDRAAPDAGYNRSLLQRVLHLLDDANGASLCNKQDAQVKDPLGLGIPLHTYDECELLRIDDLALLFVQSMAYARDGSGSFTCRSGTAHRNGNGHWRCPDGSRPIGKARLEFDWNSLLIQVIVNDSLIERMTTIDGFSTRPTPEALTRALFLDPAPEFLTDVIDPAETRHGERFLDVHSGTLPVFEADRGFDALQPLVQAFADHDAEPLMVELLSVLHRHWASSASNAVSYEAALVDILEAQPSLLTALREAAPTLNHTAVGAGESLDVFVGAARHAFALRPGLANRRGDTASVTIDGDPIPTLSPIQLLLDAYSIKRDRLAVAGDEGQAWQRSVGDLIDVLMRGEPGPDGEWRFANPRLRGVGVALIDFLRERLQVHDAAGDRRAWLLDELPQDIERVVAGPVFASAADFVTATHAQPDARRNLELLLAYLMNEDGNPDAFRRSLSSIADLLQLALDDRDVIPIAHFLGEALRPERGWVDSQTTLVRAAVDTDQTRALVRTVRNLFAGSVRGRTPIGALIDGLSEIHRAQPYEDLSAPYTAADYRAMLRGLAHFLDDNKRGLRRFISIVRSRRQ